MADAAWLPDPAGAHELRYWNGSAWTEHVSDSGTQGLDAPPAEPAPPADAVPPPVPPAAAAPAGKLGWKDRLKQVADQGKALADQGKQKLAEQNAKRAEQWANDPSTLWFGESKNAATSATGVAKARYRITRDRVWIESGLLGTRTESVPLWSIKDMDVRQAVWQRGGDVGDVVLSLEDPTYGTGTDTFGLTGTVEGTTTGQVVLDNVENPYAVLDLLTPLISEARTKKTMERQSTYVHTMTPGMPYGAPAAPPPQAAPPPTDMVEQLKKLAELRDAGILTDDEFATQKARILGG